MKTGISFLGLSSGTEMRHAAVLLVLSKHKQLLCGHCWEAAGWPSSLVTSLTLEYVLPPACLQSCVSLLLCPHRNSLLACSGVFKLAVLVMAQRPCSASTQAGNPPTFHGVPVSFPELSCIFPWIRKRANEFPSLLAKNWRNVWPSSPAVKKSSWLFTQGHEKQKALQVIQADGHCECWQCGRTRLVPGALTYATSAGECQADEGNAVGLSVTCRDWNHFTL